MKRLRSTTRTTKSKRTKNNIENDRNETTVEQCQGIDTSSQIEEEKDTSSQIEEEKDTSSQIEEEKDTSSEIEEEKDTSSEIEEEKDTSSEIEEEKNEERKAVRQRFSLVWGKLSGYPRWPAIVVSGSDLAREDTPNKIWLFWLGDHNVSQVSVSYIEKFADFEKYFDEKYNKYNYRKAVEEAVDISMNIMGSQSINKSWQEKISWAQNVKEHLVLSQLPLQLKTKLDEKKLKFEKAARKSVNIDNKPDEVKLKNFSADKDVLRTLCLSCLRRTEDFSGGIHPLFCGSLCGDCKTRIESRIKLLDSGIYCCVCFRKEPSLSCATCKKVYCEDCIQQLCEPGAFMRYWLANIWLCFLCSYVKTCGLLIRRNDWKNQLMHFNQKESPAQQSESKPRMRVLSLFDGIGTGKLVLNKLGVDVEIYYASEVNQNAISVSEYNLPGQIIQIGDITNILDEKIREICPIDLLLGGSPCNDLSGVNPARKGPFDLNGTGYMFLEYVRIRDKIIEFNGERHLYWLFENVASMPLDFKDSLTRHIGTEPVIVDAADFTPQRRSRLFWGNVPELGRKPDLEYTPKLQDYLCFGRTALMSKVRTMTTNSNSLRQGNKGLPVLDRNNEEDTLWITEIESIFGFPRHYTDVGFLNTTQRQKLLGASWSVPVIKYLLNPLKENFKIHE